MSTIVNNAMNRREMLLASGSGLLSLAIVRPSRARSPWPDSRTGAVSLTYDDGLESHLDIAMPQLEKRGLRGTFYVTMNNLARRRPDWATASTRGHELANHTMHHPCGLPQFQPETFVAREVAPMEKWLRSVAAPDRVPTYAYPCDVTNLGQGSPNRQAHRYARLLAEQGIVAARTSEGEPNKPSTVLRRPYRLQALAVGYDATNTGTVLDYLASAAERGHWAILVFHEVVASVWERGQVSAAMHAQILDELVNLRLWSAPLGQAYDAIRRRHR